MAVEVFKTNVVEACDSAFIVQMLLSCFPGSCINFDLDDCDKILRIEGTNISQATVISLLGANGYHCEVLPD
ncbi:hypothetical protein FW774_05655 [Pedobacter sp. BS3]|uniref:hypothetical protein n=1 Tax=Pedobacter sp. BS3 TaxID=2567937 RepID=UPI0011ED8183|nr:hypothetical protein [Pedobacter sp. BS3]TZF84478.1 hypothetical protein FW774_05655 [Pedobacter sp. BS3]